MQVYIHIGYPKNASTMLQMDIFPKMSNTIYCGRLYGADQVFIDDLESSIYSVSHDDSLSYDSKKVGEKVSKVLDQLKSKAEKLIISWEAFTHNIVDRGLIAVRLKQLFPDAKIILVIRNQIDSIESMYHFLVEQGGGNINYSYGRPSVRSLDAWLDEQDIFPYRSYLNTLDYDDIYSLYTKHFSSKNVCVLLFEDLNKSPKIFLDELARFLSNPNIPLDWIKKRNVRASLALNHLYKLRNWLRINGVRFSLPAPISNQAKKIIFHLSKSTPRGLFSDQRIRQFTIRYGHSNARLQAKIGKDLSSLNYPVINNVENSI